MGKALALRFAKRKAIVVLADIDLDCAEKTALELKTTGVNAKGYKCDISDISQVEELKKNVLEDFGRVDILVNNAGLVDDLVFRDCDSKKIEKLVAVNLTGCMLVREKSSIYVIKSIKRNILDDEGVLE